MTSRCVRFIEPNLHKHIGLLLYDHLFLFVVSVGSSSLSLISTLRRHAIITFDQASFLVRFVVAFLSIPRSIIACAPVCTPGEKVSV